MNTNLPLAASLPDNNMRIVSRTISSFPSSKHIVDIWQGEERVCVDAYHITNDDVAGFIPSKVIASVVGGKEWVRLIYYINDQLSAARPFDDGCYVFWFKWQEDMEVTYDATLRLFIDQVVMDDEVLVMFFVGEAEFNRLIHKRKEDDPKLLECLDLYTKPCVEFLQ